MVAPKNFVKPQKSRKKSILPIFALTILGIGGILLFAYKGVEFIEFDKDGNPKISEVREQRLERELEELNNSEQYALRVVVSGYYQCYNCGTNASLYMYTNEVWKYGVTTKQQEGRYPDGFPEEGLYYDIQFRGTYQACLEEEKRKLFQYAILPENLKRNPPIIRPPGNKIDR